MKTRVLSYLVERAGEAMGGIEMYCSTPQSVPAWPYVSLSRASRFMQLLHPASERMRAIPDPNTELLCDDRNLHFQP